MLLHANENGSFEPAGDAHCGKEVEPEGAVTLFLLPPFQTTPRACAYVDPQVGVLRLEIFP